MPPQKLSLGQKARILWLAFMHPRTSFPAKAILGGGLLYGILPLDLIPDLLPIIGITDDAGVVLLALFMFLKMTKSLRIELENDERYGKGHPQA